MKHRLERVQEVIKRELSDLIHRHVNFDGVLVTINQVDVSADLKQAHVYVGVVGPESGTKTAMNKLDGQRKSLQHELGKRISMKFTPSLHFKLDHSVERASRILQIMDNLPPIPPDKP